MAKRDMEQPNRGVGDRDRNEMPDENISRTGEDVRGIADAEDDDFDEAEDVDEEEEDENEDLE